MKKILFELARKIIYSTGLVFENIVPTGKLNGFVLCYHAIANEHWEFELSKKTFVTQMEYLLAHYHNASPKDLETYLTNTGKIEKPFFVITFDDGYQSIKVLKDYFTKKNIKPLVFLLANTDNANHRELDNNFPFLTVEDIKDLKDAGWYFGCHSSTHPDFWTLSESEAEVEIVQAKQMLEEKLGFPVEYFAYPKGRYTEKLKSIVQKAGYKMAFSTDSINLTKYVDIFAIPRIGVMRTHSFNEFKSLFLPLSIKIRNLVFSRLLPNYGK